MRSLWLSFELCCQALLLKLYMILSFSMLIVALISLGLCCLATPVIALDTSTTHIRTNNTQDANYKKGWTPQPDGRGTLDILLSCGLTMLLCSWSILCLNVPGPKESKTGVLWRKLSFTALGILCPELIFELAFGQWLSARESLKSFNSATVANRPAEDKWTMKEAFFADMGGFILHTRDQLPFPLDAKQLQYLVFKKHIELPILDRRMIEDKNKVDGLLRAITLCQITWFTVNVIGRWAQHLTVTTAELTTVSFVLCSIGTAICWWHKPADVTTAEVIESNISINDILAAECLNSYEWSRTPLDFVSRREWWWSKCFMNFVNILNHMHLTFGSNARPIDRIADSLQRELPNGAVCMCMGLTAAYFSIFFVGWNYDFPTPIERILWRAACVTMMVTASALTICSELVWSYPHLERWFRQCFASTTFKIKGYENGSRQKDSESGGRMRKKLNSVFDSIRNNSIGKDPLLYIPLKVILPMYITGFFYCHARTYILVADVIELRSLPASAYATVDWQKFWPHFE